MVGWSTNILRAWTHQPLEVDERYNLGVHPHAHTSPSVSVGWMATDEIGHMLQSFRSHLMSRGAGIFGFQVPKGSGSDAGLRAPLPVRSYQEKYDSTVPWGGCQLKDNRVKDHKDQSAGFFHQRLTFFITQPLVSNSAHWFIVMIRMINQWLLTTVFQAWNQSWNKSWTNH